MESSTTQMTVDVPDGKAVAVVDVSKEIKPPFHMVGTGVKRKGAQTEAVDFIQAIIEMTKAEQFVIRTIKDKISFNTEIGEAHIATSIFSPAELQKWKKGLRILKSKKLVCSTKRSHFMINPNAFIPKKYTKALAEWNKVMTKNHTSKSTKSVDKKTDTLPYDYPEKRAEVYEEVEALPYDYQAEE